MTAPTTGPTTMKKSLTRQPGSFLPISQGNGDETQPAWHKLFRDI